MLAPVSDDAGMQRMATHMHGSTVATGRSNTLRSTAIIEYCIW
ncbi:hypothetical protein SAMN06264855_11564 [Halorubrum vacuolatum]|uniref:Uncharacterized protein n=1 Tax=Halorubrum vacuolatum TaxID=63740 RepID=A0A238XAQ4_HALVU|nr:hypothetical protein SAMN06264855_11564 [Halorubrum vacuolatum]